MRYFFEVGEHVAYVTTDNKVRMGVVTKVEGEVVTVFFKYPERYTMDIYGWAIDPVTLDEYLGYERYYKELELAEESESLTKSIDQLIDDLMLDSEWLHALEVDLDRLNEKSDDNECGMEFVYTSPMFTLPTFANHSEWREALKRQYIEMALATGDKEWFMELTKEE